MKRQPGPKQRRRRGTPTVGSFKWWDLRTRPATRRRNRALSERRAKAVIQYLVLKHNLDLRRLVQPFGYGDSKPVADNKTAAGRAKNRRVEIRILQNKGIAMKAD